MSCTVDRRNFAKRTILATGISLLLMALNFFALTSLSRDEYRYAVDFVIRLKVSRTEDRTYVNRIIAADLSQTEGFLGGKI